MAAFGWSDDRQWQQALASCRTTCSGSATCRNVPPWWPFCPPLALPERPRRLPAIRGFFFNPSLEGGLELFELSCPSCRRRSETSAWSAAIWRFSEAINSSTSAGRPIPPLIQILSPKSPKFLSSKANSTKLWYFGLTPPWELRSFCRAAVSLSVRSRPRCVNDSLDG